MWKTSTPVFKQTDCKHTSWLTGLPTVWNTDFLLLQWPCCTSGFRSKVRLSATFHVCSLIVWPFNDGLTPCLHGCLCLLTIGYFWYLAVFQMTDRQRNRQRNRQLPGQLLSSHRQRFRTQLRMWERCHWCPADGWRQKHGCSGENYLQIKHRKSASPYSANNPWHCGEFKALQ